VWYGSKNVIEIDWEMLAFGVYFVSRKNVGELAIYILRIMMI